jgi:predicted aspartyl protease
VKIFPASVAAATFLLFVFVEAYPQMQEIPFQLMPDHRVLVKGMVGGDKEVNMLVDTGASFTAIDRKTVKRLELESIVNTVQYSAFGQSGRARMAVVRDLQVGMIRTSLACGVIDVPLKGVDIILGLNQLRPHNFMLDFHERKMRFGFACGLEFSVSFEPDPAMVVVKAYVDGQPVRALVDTGAATNCVFERGSKIWQYRRLGQRTLPLLYAGGKSQAVRVPLKALRIGRAAWKELTALMVGNPKPAGWDAVLSVGSLGVERIYFDFDQRILSWDR